MLSKESEIEAVVIATPLFWHAKMAIDAMRAGQKRGRPIHVLCEKLMGWNVSFCKKMCQVARKPAAFSPSATNAITVCSTPTPRKSSKTTFSAT